jgi:type I restriction enzyme S subunit
MFVILFYVLDTYNLKRLIFGTGQPLITGGQLKSLKIFTIPSLPEQQKIASFLTAVDKKIEQLTRKKELLEQYKKGVMQKIFSQEIRFKDDNGQDYPDWEEKRLGDVSKIAKRSKGKYNPLLDSDECKCIELDSISSNNAI